MPSSRRNQIRQLLNGKFKDWIDSNKVTVNTPTPTNSYALFADISENALHALKEGRNDDARKNIFILLTAFRWNLSHKQAQNAVNYVKLESHLPAH